MIEPGKSHYTSPESKTQYPSQDLKETSLFYGTVESLPPKSKRVKRRRKTFYTDLGNESKLCGSRVAPVRCERYLHLYGRRKFDGREWCPRCGQDESQAHKRRYGRMMSKIFYLGYMGKSHGLGYFVFTLPPEVRDELRRKDALWEAGWVCRKILSKYGFEIGISRWHFFGEGILNEDEDYELGIFHPHLNELVIGRWVADHELRAIKSIWKSYLERLVDHPIEAVNVWYGYFKEKGQWKHKGRYITRPTFKTLGVKTVGEIDGIDSIESKDYIAKWFLASELFNFRNIVYWGWGKKQERQEKEQFGLSVLKEWFRELEAEAGSEREQEDLISSVLSQMLCAECFSIDGKTVKLVAHPDDTFLYGQLKRRGLIRKEYDSGFLVLEPWLYPSLLVILNLKPMSLDWFSDFYFDSYFDTS